MRIGIAGPVSLDLLDCSGEARGGMPEGYAAPIVAHYVNALLRQGNQVNVYTTSPGIARPVVVDDEPLVVCIGPQYRGRSALTFFARERRWLGQFMRDHPSDLIHAMWSYEFALAALDSGTPCVVQYRDNALRVFAYRPDAYRLLRLLLSTYVSSRAQHQVANSEYLRAALGRAGRGMEVLPNFLPDRAADSWGSTTPRAEYMVTVSNGFGAWKNIARGLQAFQELRARGVVREYRLVGHGLGPGEEAESYARAHHLTEGVVFVGYLPHPAAMAQLAGASLLLHTSLEDSFGMAVLEAMAAGVVVAGGNTSGNIPELLDGGACGFLCDMRDVADIVRGVTSAMVDGAARERAVTRARRRCEDVYSEERVMQDAEVLYLRILGEEAGSLSRGEAIGHSTD